MFGFDSWRGDGHFGAASLFGAAKVKRLVFLASLFFPAIAFAELEPVPVTIQVDGSSTTAANPLPVTGSFSVGGSTVHVQNVSGTTMAVNAAQYGTWDEVGINDSGNSITVDGTVAATQSGGWSITSSTVGVTDAGGSLTVDMASATAKAEVFASINSSVLMSSNTQAMVVKFAEIAAATNGTNVIVSTATGRIRVIRYGMVCGAATNVYWTSGGDDVIYGGSTSKMNFAANGGISEPYCPVGIMQTEPAESLELNMSSTGPCSGGITYVEVP